ncbi:MAG: hypothetical protein ACJAYU_003628 [Bradymonadia bacterium]|jgi:hypothetical protein
MREALAPCEVAETGYGRHSAYQPADRRTLLSDSTAVLLGSVFRGSVSAAHLRRGFERGFMRIDARSDLCEEGAS